VLISSDEKVDAYTLTDRATFAQQEVKLAILVERDPSLVSSYAVSIDRASASANEAERFSLWLADGAGREAIAQFRVGQQRSVGFVPWPKDRPRALPTDLP
jgi:ABC-type tungstate transport system permease subunit